MKYISRWLAGFTFAVLTVKGDEPDHYTLLPENPPTEPPAVPEPGEEDSSPCKIVYHESEMQADCSSKSLLRIPNNLDGNIEYLDISNNTDLELNDGDLENYRKIKTLKMLYINKLGNFSKNFFAPLTEIDTLDMSGVQINFDDFFILPLTLTRFCINNSNLTSLDVSYLDQLSTLSVAHNQLTSFPKVYLTAPLLFVDLRFNPMNELTYEDVAPFCELMSLSLQLPSTSSLVSPKRFQQCCMLGSWAVAHNISDAIEGLKCTSYRSETCEEKFSNSAVSNHNACLERIGAIDPSSSIWVKILNVIVALVLISAVSFLLYRFVYKTQRQAQRRLARIERGNVNNNQENVDNEAT